MNLNHARLPIPPRARAAKKSLCFRIGNQISRQKFCVLFVFFWYVSLVCGSLTSMKYLITAGPTVEPIDPVRYLTNRSSGRMGYALAAAAAKRGHQVLLISGPTQLEIPEGVDYMPAETAEEMYQAVASQIGRMDVAVLPPPLRITLRPKSRSRRLKKWAMK